MWDSRQDGDMCRGGAHEGLGKMKGPRQREAQSGEAPRVAQFPGIFSSGVSRVQWLGIGSLKA